MVHMTKTLYWHMNRQMVLDQHYTLILQMHDFYPHAYVSGWPKCVTTTSLALYILILQEGHELMQTKPLDWL